MDMQLYLNPLNPTGISTVETRMDSCDVQTVKGSDPAMPTTSFLMAFTWYNILFISNLMGQNRYDMMCYKVLYIYIFIYTHVLSPAYYKFRPFHTRSHPLNPLWDFKILEISFGTDTPQSDSP